MHGIAAFSATPLASSVYAALGVVVDQSLTPAQSTGYLFPKNYRMLAAFTVGANLTAARINAPSLRNFILPEIVDSLVAATVTTRPPVVDYKGQGPIVMANESVVIEVSTTAAAAAIVSGFLWFTDRFTPAPGGQIYTSVATCTLTLIANQWVLGALVFNQTLPAGKYMVVGMDVVCPAAAVARLVFPGQNQWRPGCVVNVAYGNIITPPMFRMGYMGAFGEFYNTAQPQVEIFGLTAGAQTATVYLDMIKTGA